LLEIIPEKHSSACETQIAEDALAARLAAISALRGQTEHPGKREASALFPTLLRLSVCVSSVENIDGVIRILRAAAPDLDWRAKLKLKPPCHASPGAHLRGLSCGVSLSGLNEVEFKPCRCGAASGHRCQSPREPTLPCRQDQVSRTRDASAFSRCLQTNAAVEQWPCCANLARRGERFPFHVP